MHSNRRAHACSKPPRSGHHQSSHYIFVQFIHATSARLFIYSTCHFANKRDFQLSTPTRTGTAQTNPPSFLKQSRTRFRRVHWLTRSSPAGPAPQMKQGVTTIGPLPYLFFMKKQNKIALSIGLYIDCTQIRHLGKSLSGLVVSPPPRKC